VLGALHAVAKLTPAELRTHNHVLALHLSLLLEPRSHQTHDHPLWFKTPRSPHLPLVMRRPCVDEKRRRRNPQQSPNLHQRLNSARNFLVMNLSFSENRNMASRNAKSTQPAPKAQFSTQFSGYESLFFRKPKHGITQCKEYPNLHQRLNSARNFLVMNLSFSENRNMASRNAKSTPTCTKGSIQQAIF
jgi:hypothetical protein